MTMAVQFVCREECWRDGCAVCLRWLCCLFAGKSAGMTMAVQFVCREECWRDDGCAVSLQGRVLA